MSWLDRLENIVFSITTGDGKVFNPLWKNGETSKEFNASVFDFIDQEGSFINRKKVKSRKFPLVFWFTGDDNIDQADAFDISANDNRAWSVSHPFYGNITGQPLSISRNDNNYNATEINVDFWETISDAFPIKKVAVNDLITGRSMEFKSISPVNYASKVFLKPVDISTVKDNATKIDLNISAALDSSTYGDYQLAKNEMFANVDSLILAPADAIQSINEIIMLPAKFESSVGIRIRLIQAIYNTARTVLDKLTPNNKAYFEACGGAAVVSLSLAIVNPADGDYSTRTDIEDSAAALTAMYTNYLSVLDSVYVDLSKSGNSFSASTETQSQLQDTVIDTIFNLSALSFQAKQERIVILEKDSNLILLTHKYMGLDVNDANLNQFRTVNNIKNKALFSLKKGRQIKYYV